jgi:6-phosphogluconolactonase
MTHTFHEFPNSAGLDEYLASTIAHILEETVATRGHANLAVSGGRTPKEMFLKLSERNISWHNVNVVLVDERLTETESADSNEAMLRTCLLQNRASQASYYSIRPSAEVSNQSLSNISSNLLAAQAFPFDVLTLGMGEDGHTASLFPCANEIYQAMALDNPALLMRISPTTAPYDRISFTLQALLQSRHIFLHTLGLTKKQIIANALREDNVFEMPVRAFLNHPNINLEVCWAPR